MFRTTDIVKYVDGERKEYPKKMSRKTAFKHIKDLRKEGYIEDGFIDLKKAFGILDETASSTVSFLNVLKFRNETIYLMADFINKMHFKFNSIGLRYKLEPIDQEFEFKPTHT